MFPRDHEVSPSKIRGFFRGLGELAEFLRESASAVIEIAVGRWPQTSGEVRRKHKASGQGLVKAIAPYPTED